MGFQSLSKHLADLRGDAPTNGRIQWADARQTVAYAVRKPTKRVKTPRILFTISGDIIKQLGWEDGEMLDVLYDPKTGRARLRKPASYLKDGSPAWALTFPKRRRKGARTKTTQNHKAFLAVPYQKQFGMPLVGQQVVCSGVRVEKDGVTVRLPKTGNEVKPKRGGHKAGRKARRVHPAIDAPPPGPDSEPVGVSAPVA